MIGYKKWLWEIKSWFGIFLLGAVFFLMGSYNYLKDLSHQSTTITQSELEGKYLNSKYYVADTANNRTMVIERNNRFNNSPINSIINDGLFSNAISLLIGLIVFVQIIGLFDTENLVSQVFKIAWFVLLFFKWKMIIVWFL